MDQVDGQKTGRILLGDATHQFHVVNAYEVAVYKE